MSGDFFANRFTTLRDGLAFDRLAGLEIGPLDNPIVRKSEGDITYIDVADAEALRRQYDGQVDTSKIVEIDAIWGERSLAECVGGRKFDYVIASHVAEHVPDLVTWLREVQAVLKPEGELRLAMPDCRFSFDVLRDETRLVDVLTNYVLRARRPTVANVLDFRLHYAPDMSGHGRYEGRLSPREVKARHSFQLALDSAGWARDMPDRYFDVHCWVFQPRSFATVMARLAEENLVQMACTRLLDPSLPLLEFYAFLQPCAEAARTVASWRDAAAAARDPLPGSAEARPVADPELAALRARLAAIENSTSWRVTAPLRRIASRLKRPL